MKTNSVTLTLGQVAAGGIIGPVGGWVSLSVFNLIWQIGLRDRMSHGFWVGLLLIITLGITYEIIIVGAGLGIREASRRFGVDIPLKPLCSGAFLGPPAVVGLYALLDVPWEIFGNPNLILASLILVLQVLAYVISLPMHGWVTLDLPVVIWYILSIPIGAILGYRIAASDSSKLEPEP